MKKNYLCYVVLIACVVFSVSCKKEKVATTIDENTISQKLKFVDVSIRISTIQDSQSRGEIIIVSWSNWGRKSRECKGLGICDATWFPKVNESVVNPQPGNGGATILEYDAVQGKYFIDILFSCSPPVNIPSTNLLLGIDDDIVLNTASAIGNDIVLKHGEYAIINSLGQFGGYRIYFN